MPNNPFLQGLESGPKQEPESGQGNPFMQGVGAPQAQAQAPQEPQSVPGGSFRAGLDAYYRQFDKMATGVLDLVTWGDFNESIRMREQEKQAAYEETARRHPIATTVGAGAGLVGSAVLTGGGAAKAAQAVAPAASKAMAAQAAARPLAAATGGGGALSYLEYAPTQKERLGKAALGAAAGGVMAGAGYGLAKGIGAAGRYINPKKAVSKEVASTIKADLGDDITSAQLKQMIPAGQRRTPGELVGGLTKQRELSAKAGLDDMLKARKLDVKQTEQSLGAVKNIIDDLAPKGTKALKTKLYNELGDVQVSDDVLAKLKENPIVSDALTQLKSGARVTKATRELSDNSFVKLDKVKQQIDDELFNDARALDPTRKMTSENRAALSEARKELVGTLDNISDKYSPARKQAQKLILQKRYQTLLQKKGAKAGQQNELDIDETWQALFPTKESQQVFKQDVLSAGGNGQAADDVVKMLDQLRQSSLKRIWKRPSAGDSSTVSYTDKSGVLRGLADKLTGDRVNKAFLELTFNPKWVDQISKALKAPTKAKQSELFLILLDKASKASGVATGRALEGMK